MLGMASIVATSLIAGNPIPAIIGFVAEVIYLVCVPDSRWYQQRLKDRDRLLSDSEFAETFRATRSQALNQMSSSVTERFYTLEHIRQQVAVSSAAKDPWYADVVKKLDQLLVAFLNFGVKERQFRTHLSDTLDNLNRVTGKKNRRAPQLEDTDLDSIESWTKQTVDAIVAQYQTDAAEVNEKIAGTPPSDPTLSILQKRVELIQRRGEYAGKVGRMLTSVHHQMRLLEDTFGLIADEAQSRPPQQILADIDEAVFQSTILTQAIDEFTPAEQTLTVTT
ncbi:MAG: hypothetical protein JSS66_06620 [Armatimonadetes bacterium]|nr:hypothetical protein [Armatimonadota bacterium]